MKTLMFNRLTGNNFYAARPGDYYGTSNRMSDGTPVYEVVGRYDPTYPKIDFYDADGRYISSTNFYRTCRDALHAYNIHPLNGRIAVTAKKDKRA